MRQSTTTSSMQNFQILTLPNSSLNTQQNISNSSQNNNTKIPIKGTDTCPTITFDNMNDGLHIGDQYEDFTAFINPSNEYNSVQQKLPETFDGKQYITNPLDVFGAFHLFVNVLIFCGILMHHIRTCINSTIIAIKHINIFLLINSKIFMSILKLITRKFAFVNVLLFYGILMYYIRTCINSAIIILWYFNVLHQDLHHTNITSNIVSSRPLSIHACK